MGEEEPHLNGLGPAAPGAGMSGAEAIAWLSQVQVCLFVIQDGILVFANPRLAEASGWPVAELLGKRHELLAAPEHRGIARAVLRKRLDGETGPPGRIRFLRRDGTTFEAKASGRRVEFNGRAAVLVTLTDISDVLAAVQQARWSAEMHARTETLCRSGSVEVFLPDGRVRLSPGMRLLIGLGDDEPDEAMIDRLDWIPEEEHALVAGIWRHATPGEPFEFQHRIDCRDGRRLTVLHRGLVEDRRDAGGGLGGVAILQDITAQRDAELRAQELATHDEVTGLPNRAALLDHIDAAMAAATWSPRSIALLAVDVPRIADVKAKMGFGAGDALAMALAARLQEFHVDGESVAQLSDTEFALVIDGPQEADITHVLARAAALRETLQRPVRLAATEVYPLCVIGISAFPGDGQRPAELLENAQTARLGATANESIAVCAPGSNARAVREMRIESALRDALARDEFELHYQPQVELAEGRVVGAEALLRWTSAELGAVSPAEFIPVAEHYGLIGAIGDWVLRRACRQVADWQRDDLPPVRIGVNLSPIQLQRPELARELQSLLAQTGVDPARIGIEVTEGTAMHDVDHAARVLHEIRALGIEVSLDDFGTGFSSLSCLRRLPIDVVKIDRSFVKDITAAPEDVSVTRSIISMVRELRLQVLAEGVETEGQLHLLASHQCDYVQGWIFSRALPADEFAALLRQQRRLPQRFHTQARRSRTLLIVDDDPATVKRLAEVFHADGYRIVEATGADLGLCRLAQARADVIVAGEHMAAMNGLEFLRRARPLCPDSMRIVLASDGELKPLVEAVNDGTLCRFLVRPWTEAQLRAHVAEAFRRKSLEDENRALSGALERAGREREATAIA